VSLDPPSAVTTPTPTASESLFQTLQIRANLSGALIAQPPSFSSALIDHLFDLRRTSGFSRTGATGARFKIASETMPIVSPGTAAFPSPSRTAQLQGKQIRTRIHLRAPHLFGRHVRGGAHHGTRFRQRIRLAHRRHRRKIHGRVSQHQLRQAKIQNLYVTALGDKDVRWLDVPMNDPFAVCSAERVRYLTPPFQYLVSSSGLPAMRCFSVAPSMNSMAINAWPSSSPSRRSCIYVGDSARTPHAPLARKRSRACGSRASASGEI